MIRDRKRILAIILSVILMLCCFPTTSFSLDAVSSPTTETSTKINIATDEGYTYLEQEIETDEIIGEVEEITELREESVKHFRLSNGMYKAISYKAPVHRKDENGVWQDIDNSLKSTDLKGLKVYSTTDSRVSFAVSYYFSGSSGSMLAGAYQILSAWNESTITYNNAPPIGTELLSSTTLFASSATTTASPGETSFEITGLANQWYNGTANNYGIMIKRLESATDTLSNAKIKSSESDYSPYLNITYTYHIPDGVYALQNAYGSNYWMTYGGDVVNGGNIQQKTSTVSPANADVFDRTSLFKITHVGSFYVIRSMVNNNLSISVSGTSVVTKEISNNDPDVASTDRFYIEWTGTGYLIRPVGTSNVIAMSESFETNFTVMPKSSATVMANWNLVQYTDTHKSGGIIYFPSTWSNHGIIEDTVNEIFMVGRLIPMQTQ